MPTLNIGGQRVKVDDAFLQMTPEQQNAAVEEIAKFLPAQTAPQSEQTAVDPDIAKAADAYEKVRGNGAFSAATDAGATGIPFSDELYSAASALPNAAISAVQGKGFHPVDEYERSQALQAELQRRRQEQHPVASTVGAVAGGLGATAPLSGGGLSFLNGAKPTLASLAGRGAAEGAAYGGVYGAGEGSGLRDRAANAGLGALSGGLAGGAFGGVGRVGASKVNTSALPTADDLKTAAQAAYQRADDAGVVYSKDAMKRIRDALMGEFAEFGYHPELQGGAKVALNEIDRLSGGNATLKGLDTARKIAGNAFQPGNKSNNALTSKVASAIDDLIANPQTGDILAGNGADASAAIRQARELHSRSRKLEIVNELLDRAGLNAGSTGAGGNVENATRQQLKRLLTNPKFTRGLSPEEQEAARKAVLGTKTQNALRLAGKLSPQGNGLMLTMGMGAAALKPEIAIPAMVAGAAAKKGSEAMTREAVRELVGRIASGGNMPAPQLSAIRQQIIEALTRGASQQVPAYISQ